MKIIGSITLLALQSMQQASAFSIVPSIPSLNVHSSARTSLFAQENNDDGDISQSINSVSRRDAAFQMVATTTAAIVSMSSSAYAEGEGGRLIEFTVNNLDGEEGKTGSFVVQTRPEWAPIGAERFEVRSLRGKDRGFYMSLPF